MAARDGYVVAAEPVSTAVQQFVEQWKRDRPPSGGRFGSGADARTEVTMVRAIDWLVQESGLDDATIAPLLRGRKGTTDIAIADALLTAIGKPELLDTLRWQRI